MKILPMILAQKKLNPNFLEFFSIQSDDMMSKES